MFEFTSTRSNELIDPHLHAWGWEIPIYLFLGGLVAGMMIISGFFLFRGRHRSSRCACFTLPTLGLIFLSLGMGALFLDLEHKLYVWRLYLTFEWTSPMSWGSWILLLVYPALIANFLLRAPEFLRQRFPWLDQIAESILSRPFWVRFIGGLNMGLGVLLGIYTGILLSSLGARPVWDSAILGPLFLVSGLSAAAAFVHMIADDAEERVMLARADNTFLGVELVVILLYIIGLVTSTEVHQRAAGLFLGGPYTASFWVFVVIMGIVIPLVVQNLATRHRIQHTPVAPILVLAGGLILRFVIVSAGQASHWNPI